MREGENQKENKLSIFSLNIETDKHLDRIINFIEKNKPDVVLLQEVYLKNVNFLQSSFNMKGFFTELCSFNQLENSNLGLLNLTAHPIINHQFHYYRGDALNIPTINKGKGEGANTARAIAVTEFSKNNRRFSVINTHFTWTPDGQPSSKQYEDIEVLLNYLDNIPEFVLCGDFNAPRGGPIFEKLAKKYKDNIPQHITTTIDKNLHKAGDLNLVVDGMFTTKNYFVESIEVISGLSDHCAIYGSIQY